MNLQENYKRIFKGKSRSNDGKLIEESITNMDPKANMLHQAISEAIFRIDENMNYKIFADAVALMLEDGYGAHNYDQFLDHLRMQLNKS